MRCSGAKAKPEKRGQRRGCPFASKRFAVPKSRRLDLTKRLKRYQLPRTTVHEFRILAPGAIGKVVRYTVKGGKVPTATTLCLPPGAPRPARC